SSPATRRAAVRWRHATTRPRLLGAAARSGPRVLHELDHLRSTGVDEAGADLQEPHEGHRLAPGMLREPRPARLLTAPRGPRSGPGRASPRSPARSLRRPRQLGPCSHAVAATAISSATSIVEEAPPRSGVRTSP